MQGWAVWGVPAGVLALVLLGPLLLLPTPLARLAEIWVALLLLGFWNLLMAILISFMIWNPAAVFTWLEGKLRLWVAMFAANPSALWLQWSREATRSELARWCLDKAVQGGDPEAVFQEGLVFLEGGFGAGGQSAAMARFHRAGLRGHAEAAYRLAEGLRSGLGSILAATEVAEGWYQRAARLGFGPAAEWLAQAYASGDGVALDAAKALRWSQIAERLRPYPPLSHSVLRHDAATEDPLLRLAGRVSRGVDRVAGRVVATRRGRWALFLGLVGLALVGLFGVGLLVWSGSRVLFFLPVLAAAPPLLMLTWQAFQLRQDRPRTGRDRLLEAAEAGDPEACYRLGLAYQAGSPARPRDDLSAGLWFRKAAEAGHREAMTALSAACLGGHGMVRDPREAARWAEAARSKSTSGGGQPIQETR